MLLLLCKWGMNFGAEQTNHFPYQTNYRAKNHISPGEHYFATFTVKLFQCADAIWVISLKLLENNLLEFIVIKKYVSVKSEVKNIVQFGCFGDLCNINNLSVISQLGSRRYLISLKFK